ncbi:MAG TPA: riboflavin synthase [Gemmatimonas sp.]|nr:riboflavin synthase [Gemmatimonas sp.]
MFTGLVDDVGTITAVADTPAGRELRIECRYTGIVEGESIAVNGACLTVREYGTEGGASRDVPATSVVARSWFTVAAVVTTLGRTCIGEWRIGDTVNLERAMRLGDRLGGHLVLGHVDDLGVVVSTETRDDAWLVNLSLPVELQRLMVPHGSLTVNGVSLTVNELLHDGVQLSIIDYTRRHTTLGALVPAARVHIEADILAKHVARLVAPHLTSQAAIAGAIASVMPAAGVLA